MARDNRSGLIATFRGGCRPKYTAIQAREEYEALGPLTDREMRELHMRSKQSKEAVRLYCWSIYGSVSYIARAEYRKWQMRNGVLQ